jgi:hypothetical protein
VQEHDSCAPTPYPDRYPSNAVVAGVDRAAAH